MRDPLGVRPYVSLLNTSTWLLYASDVDPACSDPELLACLLAHGDWMAQTGEVAFAAVRGAAWWLERTDDECAAFAAAVARSARPDAAAWRALADALPWLRRLHHDDAPAAARGEPASTDPGNRAAGAGRAGGGAAAARGAMERGGERGARGLSQRVEPA